METQQSANQQYFDDLFLIRTGPENFRAGHGTTRIKKIDSLDDWQEKKIALKNLYLLTLGQEPENLSVPFEAKIESEQKCDGFIKRKISYWLMKDERVTSYMLIPNNIKDKLPAILCIPPTTPLGKEQTIGNDNTPQGQDRAYALHLVKEGFITFAFDWITAGERKFPNAKHFQTAPFYEKFPKWSVRGKDIFDIKRTIDLLTTFPEIDTNRIASIGHSQGGGLTIEAMAIDDRIKTGVSSCGAWPARFSKNPFNHCRQTKDFWTGRPILANFAIAAKQYPIDLHELLAMIAPKPFMLITALNDFRFSLDELNFTTEIMENLNQAIRKIYKLHSETSENNFVSVTHTEGHSFKASQRLLAYQFLKQHLSNEPPM